MRACPSCGESSPDRFTECAFCGTPLADRGVAPEERKVLSVVFCDLAGSTALGERLDPEAMGEVLDLYYTTTTRVLRRHGGAIQKFIGDAVVAAFGIPVAHEDDALRAVRAASEMREAIARLNRQLAGGYGVELEVHIGVHTGEAVIRTAINDQQVLTGDTLNTAARLEQAAEVGEVIIGEPTYRLVRDAIESEALPPLELRGKAGPVRAYRLLRVFGDEQASRRHDAPMVGREEEQRTLLTAFASAVGERRCFMTTVIGEAGVGKSRLVRSLVEATSGDARILRSRCLPYGDGVSFWPVLSIIRDACSIGADDSAEIAIGKLGGQADDDEVTRRVASAMGWSGEELPLDELVWGIREFLKYTARDRPLVLVVDDVHWAAVTLVDLLDHLVETVEDAPILLVCTARPDILDERPEWSRGPRRTRLVLDRLPDEAAGLVIDNLLAGVSLPDDLRQVVVRASEGNPLFVEQLVSMLVDSGVLVEESGGWRVTRSPRHLEIPPSISALLTARLDLLASGERAVIEPAAVIGLEFPTQAVRDLVPADVSHHVDDHLATMVRKQLVRPTDLDAVFVEDHRFHHILIRDAAYQRSLKRTRAELHERFAEWIDRSDEGSPRAGEHDEMVGYHLEQAHAYRTQLGPTGESVLALGSRAAARLAAAGRRAFVRGDLPAAVNLLSRARSVLPSGTAERLRLLPDLGEALLESGSFAEAATILEEGESPEAERAEPVEVARARLVHLLVDLYAGNEDGWAERVEAELSRSLPIFVAAADHRAQATAWRLRYGVAGTALRFDAAAAAAEEILRHAAEAGDQRQQRRGAVAYALSALHGPTPVDAASVRCRELIDEVEGDRRTTAAIQLCLAQLVAMSGKVDEGRQLAAEATAMLAELGTSVLSASTSTDVAAVEVMAGDYAEAERVLRKDFEQLDALGETFVRSTVSGMLARVLVLAGRHGDARVMCETARSIAAPDDLDAQVLWRSALARIEAIDGRMDDAVALADEAVAIAGRTTDHRRRAEALVDRAHVLARAGRREDATVDLTEARELYELKGDRIGASATRDALADLGAAGFRSP